jgi:uncharacterized protein involved in exopolysaccharide biosynthesis
VAARLAQVTGALTRQESRRRDLDRDLQAAESYYASLRQRSMELDALASSPEGEFDLRVVDPVHNPDGERASTPNWDLVLPVAFLAALLFALFVAFFLEYWRSTYRAPWEVEAETGTEVLAAVPRMREGRP